MSARYTAATQAAVAAGRQAGHIVEMTSVVPVDVDAADPQYQQVLRLAQDSGCQGFRIPISRMPWTLHFVFKAGEQESFCVKMRELMAGREEIEVSVPGVCRVLGGDGGVLLDGFQARLAVVLCRRRLLGELL